MKFAAIHEYRGERAIRMMCRVLGVSRGGHYDWVDRPDSARARRHRTLTEKIRQVHHASPETLWCATYPQPALRPLVRHAFASSWSNWVRPWDSAVAENFFRTLKT